MSKCEDVFIVLWYFFCANKKKERKKEKEKRKKKEKEKEEKRKIQLSLLPFHLSPVFPSLNSSFAFLLLLPNQIQKEKRTPFLSGSVNVGISMFFRYIFSQHPPLLHSKKMFYVLFLVMRRSQKPGGTTLVRVFQKNSPYLGLVPFLFPFLYSSFRMYNAPTFRAAQQCHWRARHCCIGRVLDIVGLGHYNNNKGLVPRVLFLFSVSKKNPTIQTTLKKTRLEQNPVQSRLFQLGPPVQPSSPEPRK